MSVFVEVEDVHIISLYIFTEYGLSYKRRLVDNLAHICYLVNWTWLLRNAVFALCFLKCVFIQMLFWFSDLESSKLYLSVSWLLEFLDLGFWE